MTGTASRPGIVGIGDNVVDYYQDRDIFYPGGNALNVAVLAKRYGLRDAGYIGLIGSDAEGRHVRDALVREGIWIGRLRQAEGETGKAVVTLNAEGDRVFVSSNRGGVCRALALRMDAEDIAAIERYGHVHSSVFSYLEPELPKIRRHARSVSFDFSTRRDPDYLAEICPHITAAFFSGSDLAVAAIEALVATVAAHGVETVGVTRGGEGALWWHRGRSYRQGTKPAVVVDTLGAGDAFLAGYLAATLTGRSVEDALDFAATKAAEACGHFGAFGYPSRPEVQGRRGKEGAGI